MLQSGLDQGSEEPNAQEEEQEEEEEGQEAADDQEEGYWDEEDEIEQYLKDRFDGDESSDDEPAGSEYGPGASGGGERRVMPDNPTLEDLNAETQRILRGEDSGPLHAVQQRLWRFTKQMFCCRYCGA